MAPSVPTPPVPPPPGPGPLGPPPAPRAPSTDLGRLLFGLTVVTLGVLFLLDAAGVLNSGDAIGDWWPLVIVAAGVFTLLERPPALFRGGVLTAVGVLLLLLSTGVLDEGAWGYIWPVAIIAAGLAVVVRWSGRGISAAPSGGGDEVVRATAVFSGSTVANRSGGFRGAWLTAIFGGVTLDLRGAHPVAEGASVNATAAFGGVEILVPRGWRTSIRSTPIFGGVEDKTEQGEPSADAPALHVDAVCVFGGVEIKHEK